MKRLQILIAVIALSMLAGVIAVLPLRFRPLAWIVVVGIVALALFATLRSGPSIAPADCAFPVQLNARVYDVVQNVVLFVPLGMGVAAALVARQLGAAVVCGAALSTCIEVAQRFDPTRCPSAIDVVSNSAGALLGAFFVVGIRRVLPAPSPLS